MKKVSLIALLLFLSIPLFAQKWLWAGQGNTQSDLTAGVVDAKGNVYITAPYVTTITFGSHVLNAGPTGNNSYTIKYDSTGNIVWTSQPTVYAGFPNNFLWELSNAIDNNANIFTTGIIAGEAKFGAYILTTGFNGYGYVPFLVKYDANGNVRWAKQAENNGMSNDVGQAYAVATDNLGNAYETGLFEDTLAFGADSVKDIIGGNNNAYLVKYDSTGNVMWARQGNLLTTASSAYGYYVCTDHLNNVYVTGYFSGRVVFGADTLRTYNSINIADIFLVKYDANGNELWARQGKLASAKCGGRGYSVITDNANNVYFTGYFQDTLSLGPDTLKNALAFGFPTGAIYGDIFLAKYDPSGNLIWLKQSYDTSKSIGWSGWSLRADNFNNIYFTAGTYGGGAPTVGTGRLIFQKDTFVYAGDDPDPVIIMKLDTAGNVLCAEHELTAGDDQSILATDPTGKYAYWLGDARTIMLLGNDSIDPTNQDELPFVVRWQPCASACSVRPGISGASSICFGQSVKLSASGGANYVWSNGATTDTITVTPNATSKFTVTISSDTCRARDSISVYVNPAPVIYACCDSSILQGQSVQLTSSGGGLYIWNPPVGLSCDLCASPIATPSQTTTYTLTVTSDSGCTTNELVTIDVSCGNVFVPDAFSPNNDGQNDVLYVRGYCISEADFVVYDRWGNKVFETTNISQGWDGKYKGEPENAGTYAYFLKASMSDGTSLTRKGNITLVR
jgi:gliding motility-associated-like protein